MENGNKKVVSAITEVPSGGDGFFDFGKYPDGTHPTNGTQRLKMMLDDGSVEYMEYYGDEISISPDDVIGKTLKEAWGVFSKKDIEYLQS